MKTEISSAVNFLSNLLRTRVDAECVDNFSQRLKDILNSHYQNHWFPGKPFKGSGYRCIRIVNNKMDPLVSRAGVECGLSPGKLLSLLPSEFTLWIDPSEVSYRIGEEGSIGSLLDETSSSTSDSDSSSVSSDSDDSQSQSPVHHSHPHQDVHRGSPAFLTSTTTQGYRPVAVSQGAMSHSCGEQYYQYQTLEALPYNANLEYLTYVAN